MLKSILLFAAVAVALPGFISSLSAAPAPARIVFMIGEDEYHTWDTLPEFAEKELKPLGYRVTIIQQDAADHNNFPGLVAALHDADLLFVSVRRRTPPKDQLDAVRAHLAAGKPLVGIRTACHAFALARTTTRLTDPKLDYWQGFDPEVLGGHYTTHYEAGPLSAVALAPGADKHPITSGISVARLVGNGALYKVSPLDPATTPLLTASIPGQPAEPIAWTHLYGAKKARVFFTSLGHPDDFKEEEFRRLLVNGVAWAVGKK